MLHSFQFIIRGRRKAGNLTVFTPFEFIRQNIKEEIKKYH